MMLAASKTKKPTAKKSTTKKTKATKKTATKKVVKKTTKKTTAKKTTKSKRTKVICISHKEDADGISSAALIRQAFGGDAMLVDYPGQMEALQQELTCIQHLVQQLGHLVENCTVEQTPKS